MKSAKAVSYLFLASKIIALGPVSTQSSNLLRLVFWVSVVRFVPCYYVKFVEETHWCKGPVFCKTQLLSSQPILQLLQLTLNCIISKMTWYVDMTLTDDYVIQAGWR